MYGPTCAHSSIETDASDTFQVSRNQASGRNAFRKHLNPSDLFGEIAPICFFTIASYGRSLRIACKIVRTVDSHEIDKTDPYRFGRASEGAADTADAVFPEAEFAVLEGDILCRTAVDAFHAADAFYLIHAEKASIFRIKPVLDPTERGNRLCRKGRSNRRFHSFCNHLRRFGNAFFGGLPHQRRCFVRMPEYHIIGHDIDRKSVV